MSSAKPVTVCVLAYGDHAPLLARCLESLRALPDSLYDLDIWMNAPGRETFGLVDHFPVEVRRLRIARENVGKCAAMRGLFTGVESEFVWWFDDDVYLLQESARAALPRRLTLARCASPDVVAWGHVWTADARTWSYGLPVPEFCESADWYRGLPLPRRWWPFLAGYNWFARMDALRRMDWPDRRLDCAADDVFLGEAIRQDGSRFADVGSLDIGGSGTPRRGGARSVDLERALFRPNLCNLSRAPA